MPEVWLYVPHDNSHILCFALNYGGSKNTLVRVLEYIYFDIWCVEPTSNFIKFFLVLYALKPESPIGQQLISNSWPLTSSRPFPIPKAPWIPSNIWEEINSYHHIQQLILSTISLIPLPKPYPCPKSWKIFKAAFHEKKAIPNPISNSRVSIRAIH